MFKNQQFGKMEILEEPFSINARKYCKARCNLCGKEVTTQLRLIKKGRGCQCKLDSLNLIGKRFGKLVVTKLVNIKTILCKCDCGNEKIFYKYNVIKGNSTNCGCEHYTSLLERNYKHGQSRTRLYTKYLGMKNRCYNKKSYSYKWYGGKGIKICDEWLGENGFDNFFNWAIQNGYNKNLSIERIDINKDYCPSNCKWIPMSEQLLNTSKTIKIETDNGDISVKDLSLKFNIPKSTIYSRIKKLNKNIVKENEIIGSTCIL